MRQQDTQEDAGRRLRLERRAYPVSREEVRAGVRAIARRAQQVLQSNASRALPGPCLRKQRWLGRLLRPLSR